MTEFKQVDEKTLVIYARSKNLGEIQAFRDAKLERWRDEPLNVAVTGSSGQGKSSLVNAILNISNDTARRAAVGVKETTKEVKQYKSPDNENVVFWDLPGVGTDLFPRETYLRDVNFERYDFFIVVSELRFTEEDKWLVEQIIKQKKAKFFFVRSKIDSDVKNDKRTHPRKHNQAAMLTKIRADIKQNLGSLYSPDDVFLVSSAMRNEFDFENMTNSLIERLPELKGQSLIMSLQNITDSIIEKKKKFVQDRIGFVARESSRRENYPLPRTDLRANLSILAQETEFQNQQFGKKCIGLQRAIEDMKTKLKEVLPRAKEAKRKSPSLELHHTASYMLLKENMTEGYDFAKQALAASFQDVVSQLEDMHINDEI